MATNNAINLKSSGIASYDGAGTFTALANPLTVANGGTGDSTLTAYSVLCGGTTTTNPVQSVASLGSIGTILTSNDAGALPSFEGGPGGNVLKICTGITSSVTDGATYFIRAFNGLNTSTTTGNSAQRLYIPTTGTIISCKGIVTMTGTGSNESVSIIVRLNNSSDTTVTSTLDLSSSPVTFSNNSMSISVTQGDYVEIKFVSPTWSTNPTSVSISVTLNLI